MEEARQKNSEDLQNSGNVGRTEEAVEEENNSKLKNIFSFIFQKILEEWKKLGKKFRRPGNNSGNVGRMEEAVKEEHNSKLKNILSLIFQKFLEEWKKLGKKFKRPAKLWKCWKNGRSCRRKKNSKLK